MCYQIAFPSILLSDIIKSYWALDSYVHNKSGYVQRIVPAGLHELTFYFGNHPESSHPENNAKSNSLLSGLSNRYHDLTVRGHIKLFSVLFKPHGLAAILDIPVSEIYNQTVPLDYVLKNLSVELEDKLFEASNFYDRVKIIEATILKLFHQKANSYQELRIAKSIETISKITGQKFSISTLASDACYSRKQYERIFKECVGISPRQFLKTIRFQRAIHKKSLDKNISLTSLSYASGYFDQSHMTNDFKKLSGMSPKQYFTECDPVSDYFD